MNRQFVSQHIKDIIFSINIYELSAAYGIELNDIDDLRQLMKLVERDLTGRYVDMPCKQ